MQAIVDSRARFMDFSMRPGSCSDKNLWSMSMIGQNITQVIPKGMHLVGDAGYTLTSTMMIPYNITEEMSREEKRFNYLHSSTRICVERAFGLLKGRWRIFKRPLNMKTPASVGRTIIACMVLHNLTMSAGDSFGIPKRDRQDEYQGCHLRFLNTAVGDKAQALLKRDQVKKYLVNINPRNNAAD
jgi:hypothetical protein